MPVTFADQSKSADRAIKYLDGMGIQLIGAREEGAENTYGTGFTVSLHECVNPKEFRQQITPPEHLLWWRIKLLKRSKQLFSDTPMIFKTRAQKV